MRHGAALFALLISIALLLRGTTSIAGPVPIARVAAVDFDSQVLPILSENCFRCHGGVRELGTLNLITRERATQSLKSGAIAVVPLHAASSEMIRRINLVGTSKQMPPSTSALSPHDRALLARWIDEGAVWEKPWALQEIADPAQPQLRNAAWVREGLDAFVLAELEQRNIKPAAEASRASLLRRVSLDLTGLPPEPEELAAFVADASDDAYERVVDRLLASPHYGERFARLWLDLARYADTQGYEKDGGRTVWLWRDWVIDALNADMHYDEFSIRLLAGDLLDGATESDRIATSFHRNTLTNTEGGTDDEEFRMAAVMDRVATTWQAWMGTTFQCAQCHSHPFEPYSHREYYEFLAFFNQSADADRDDDAPILKIASTAFGESSVPVMEELPAAQARTTHLLLRGSLAAPSDAVAANTPSMLPSMDASLPRNRLGLARWLFDPSNPLTARVAANRQWEALFGRGVVETSEDFARHPEVTGLLDHLATRLQSLDYSMKAFTREIVLSATYRQSSLPSTSASMQDPDNRFFSRAMKRRLEAETVRDTSLAVGGILTRAMHGPPVMPMQPNGVWQTVYNGADWKMSEGDDATRRSIYTYWKRTSPHPQMIALDAPSRETCTVRRIETNTPIAVLALWNDPAMLGAARGLARRALAQHATSLQAQTEYMFQTALVRNGTAEEVARFTAFIESEALRFSLDDAARAAFLADANAPVVDADLTMYAALASGANLLLNLDEFLTTK